MNLLDVGFLKKIGSWSSSFNSKYFVSQGRLTWKMLKKVVFCITELWTEHIKKFHHAPNDFFPNVLSVKTTSWNPCIAFLSDSLFNVNMAQHVFFVEEISKKIAVLLISAWGCDFFFHAKNDFERRETNFAMGKNGLTRKQNSKQCFF